MAIGILTTATNHHFGTLGNQIDAVRFAMHEVRALDSYALPIQTDDLGRTTDEPRQWTLAAEMACFRSIALRSLSAFMLCEARMTRQIKALVRP